MGLFSRKIKKIIKDLEKKEDKSLKVEEKKIEVKEKKEVETVDLTKKKEVKKEKKKVKEKKEDKKVQKEIEDKKRAYKILIKPIISEKATLGVSQGKYVFEVSSQANKVEIKKAINEVYGVEVIKVNIINNLGKKVRFGRRTGRQKDTRKAIITLKKGETINIYEGI